MTRKQRSNILYPDDVVRKEGKLYARCCCGTLDPIGAYGAAQMGAGNTIVGRCSNCKRIITIVGRDQEVLD